MEGGDVSLSFEEAAKQYAATHKVALDIARIEVADLYATEDRSSEEQHRVKLDRPLPDDGLVYHPRPRVEGVPVRIDSLPSPAWTVVAARAVREAKIEGDYYRAISRPTSMHLIGDLW